MVVEFQRFDGKQELIDHAVGSRQSQWDLFRLAIGFNRPRVVHQTRYTTRERCLDLDKDQLKRNGCLCEEYRKSFALWP